MKKITKKIKTLELSSAQVANIARMNTNYYDTIVPAPQYVLEQVAKTVEEERKVVFRHVVYKKETHNEANDLIQTFWVNLSEFAEKYPLLDLYKKLPPDGIVLEKDYDNIKKDVKYRTSLYKDLIKNRKDRLEKMNFIKRLKVKKSAFIKVIKNSSPFQKVVKTGSPFQKVIERRSPFEKVNRDE